MNTRAALRLAPADKIVTHPQFADHLAGKRVYPVGVEVSPSGACTASCDFCFYSNGNLGNHRKIFLDTARAIKLLGEFADLGVKSVSWTGGGEPSLHPEIGELVNFAAQVGLQQGIFTNSLAAPRFDPAKMEWIRVTMTDKPYKPEHIKRLRTTKNLSFAFNYDGSKASYDYLWETLHLAEDVGADYVQARPALRFHGETVDIEPPNMVHPMLFITEDKFRDAKKKHSYCRCEAWKFVPFIWETGEVHVCSYVRPIAAEGGGYALGDIYKQTFREIMDNAPECVAVRSDCQVACKLNTMNETVHRARALQDVNFP